MVSVSSRFDVVLYDLHFLGSTPLAMGGTGADSSGETGGEGKLEVTVGLEEKAGGSVPVGAGGKVSVGVHPTITPKETVKVKYIHSLHQ